MKNAFFRRIVNTNRLGAGGVVRTTELFLMNWRFYQKKEYNHV